MKGFIGHRTAGSVLAVLATALSACHDRNRFASLQPVIIGAPAIEMSGNARSPLSAALSVSTNIETRITLHVFDGVNSWDISYRTMSLAHELPVRGLHPGRSHTFSVTATSITGATTAALNDVLTLPPLPADFPALDITVTDSTRLEPGFTLFVPTSDSPYIIAVDTFGEVAWYLAPDQSLIGDLRILSNGNLIFVQQNCRLIEMDFDGNVMNAWDTHRTGTGACTDLISDSIRLPIESAHHEVFEMPSGNLLTLSWGDVAGVNYPNSDEASSGSSIQTIREDIVVEFSRDGAVVQELHLSEILDPTRIGYDSVGGVNDWTHGNAIIFDDRDNSYIFSARNQDAIFKFGRDDGVLKWILGTPSGWIEPWFSKVLIPTNFSAAQFFWHQHAPQITRDGTIMLYDNGNFRARPYATQLPASQNYSRAVEYAIDETTMQVTQLWEYGSPATSTDRDYTPFIGDADVLPVTGNVLINFGGITRSAITGLPTELGANPAFNARIVEVTHGAIPEKLLEIYCGTVDHADGQDCRTYRAVHIASLVPEFQ